MKYVILNEIEFEGFSKNHKLNNIFQTTSWAKTKNNWQSIYVGVKQDNDIICATLILIKKLPLNFKFAYIPKGALINYDNQEICDFFFNNLKKHLFKENVILCKIDPNIVIKELNFENKDEVKYIKDNNLVKLFKNYGLYHCGYNLSFKESIQPRIQLEIETENFEEIIPNKTMKKIKSSIKKGVVVLNEKHNIDSLVKMVEYTKNRHNINLRNEEYFKNLLNSFNDDACVLSAYYEDTLISSCLLVKCFNTTEILYSGYKDEYKNLNSTYTLRYEAIKYSKDNNCKSFNFGGVDGNFSDGLTMFKSSFNPKIKVFIGEFDILPIPILSKVVQILFPYLKRYLKGL